jgi:hypothetical protein
MGGEGGMREGKRKGTEEKLRRGQGYLEGREASLGAAEFGWP